MADLPSYLAQRTQTSKPSLTPHRAIKALEQFINTMIWSTPTVNGPDKEVRLLTGRHLDQLQSRTSWSCTPPKCSATMLNERIQPRSNALRYVKSRRVPQSGPTDSDPQHHRPRAPRVRKEVIISHCPRTVKTRRGLSATVSNVEECFSPTGLPRCEGDTQTGESANTAPCPVETARHRAGGRNTLEPRCWISIADDGNGASQAHQGDNAELINRLSTSWTARPHAVAARNVPLKRKGLRQMARGGKGAQGHAPKARTPHPRAHGTVVDELTFQGMALPASTSSSRAIGCDQAVRTVYQC